jgi:hypothetical protein
MIENLPLLTPDGERGERTIARCHAQLARRRRRLDTSTSRTDPRYLLVERALIGGLCVIYISGVAIVAIRMPSGG